MMTDRPRIDRAPCRSSSLEDGRDSGRATSYLGDGGTILGTAVGAGVSTTGFAVYTALPGAHEGQSGTGDHGARPPVDPHHSTFRPGRARGYAAGPARHGQTWPGASRPGGRQPDPADGGQTRDDLGRPERPGQTGPTSARPARLGQTRRPLYADPERPRAGRSDVGQTRATSARPAATASPVAATADLVARRSRTRADVGLADAETARFGAVRIGGDAATGPTAPAGTTN